MKKTLPVIADDEDIETLLRGLIAECLAILHGQVRPALAAARPAGDRLRIVRVAIALLKAGAIAGETIARLRGRRCGAETGARLAGVPVHPMSTRAGGGEGRGNDQTNTAQALVRPRTRRRGGQPGNRNAMKPVPALSTLRKSIRAFKRRVRTAALQVAA